MTQAVIFGAFGTLVRIGCRTNPYLRLLKRGRHSQREHRADDLQRLMTHDVSFAQAVEFLEIQLETDELADLEERLARELSSVELFPDSREAITLLKQAGIKVGLCSNLTAPYGAVLRRLLPDMDAYTFSYEQGCIKPDALIYRLACASLGEGKSPGFGRVRMLGDSPRCDQFGPRTVGVMGHRLDRFGQQGFASAVDFSRAVLAER